MNENIPIWLVTNDQSFSAHLDSKDLAGCEGRKLSNHAVAEPPRGLQLCVRGRVEQLKKQLESKCSLPRITTLIHNTPHTRCDVSTL